MLLAYLSSALLSMIANKSRTDVENAKSQDVKLEAKENDAKAQATALEQAAKDAATNEPKVGGLVC